MFRANRLVFLITVTASAQARLQYVDFGSQLFACCMVADARGNAYLAADVPTSLTTAQMIIYKVDSSNNVVYRMAFAVGVGGPKALALDAGGDLFVAGITTATDFPLVNPLVHASPTQSGTGFLSKIDPTGTHLLFSTFVGGMQIPSTSAVDGVAVDSTGNVYLTGSTTATDFPITTNAFSRTGNAFVMKLTNAGDQIFFSTFLGPSAGGYAIAVDVQGLVTVAGIVSSPSFPSTPGTFQTSCHCNPGNGGIGPPVTARTASFISRLSADGSKLLWSTFLGGTGVPFGPSQDVINALALTADGGVVVAGTVESSDFPVTPGAFQATWRGSLSGAATTLFVTRLNSTASALIFSTFLGGSTSETFSALTLDVQGHPWVSGRTSSPDFPFLPGTPPLGDEFVVELAADGSSLLQTQAFPEGSARIAVSLVSGSEILFGRSGSLLRIPLAGLSGISILGQANAGAYSVSGHVAPGEVISLYGSGLGSATGVGAQLDSNGQVATTLAGMQVFFDGTQAPVLFVGNNQINVVVPFGVSGKTQTTLQVVSGLVMSLPLQLAVVPADPSIFSYLSPPSGAVYAAALNQDGSYNTPGNPAGPGSIVVFWANGAGVFTPALTDGELPQSPPAQPEQPVSVLFDHLPVELVFEGAAPGVVAGLLQVNARLPQTMNLGTYHTLELKIGNFTSAQVQVAAHP